MNIFFDVDYTILGLDNTLRPSTREVFQRLVEDGHKIYIWSGQGIRWDVVREHRLEPLVSGVFAKPTFHYEERLAGLGVTVMPDFIVDDYPEIVHALGGMWVPPYYFSRTPDQEMERVYRVICEFTRQGHSQDRQYKAKGSQVPLF